METMKPQTMVPENLVLEVVDGSYRQHCRVTSLPFRIGRGVDNDLILPGNTVSPHHAEIFLDNGTLRLRDMASENGTRIQGRRLSTAVTIPDEGMHMRLGQARVHIRTPHTALAPTHRTGCHSIAGCLLLSWPAALLYFVLNILLGVLTEHLNAAQSLDLNTIMYAALGSSFGILFIAGILAIVSRFTAHRWAWSGNIAFAALLSTLLDWPLPIVINGIAYFFSLYVSPWLDIGLLILLFPLFSALMASRILQLGQAGTRNYALAGIVLGLLSSLGHWAANESTLVSPDDHQHAQYDANLALFDIRLAQDISPKDFFQEAAKLKPEPIPSTSNAQ